MSRGRVPRTITDEQVELVITKTLEERGPGEDTHWSTRSMAAATGMSQSAVSRIWRAFGLKPHLVQTWKLSTDPQFVEVERLQAALRKAGAVPPRYLPYANQNLH
jgi:AraC-like DNA-binding protein